MIESIERDGYVILEGLLTPNEVGEVRDALRPFLAVTPFGDNSFVGRRTRRAFGLPAATRALDGLLTHPAVLRLLDDVLGRYLLSTVVAVEIDPGETAQTLHTDASAWPVGEGVGQIVVNAIWALDDFTTTNGATSLVPGSHLGDAPPAADAPRMAATMTSGSVLVYVGTLWHGGGANESTAPRLGLIVGYTVAWLRPQENFALTCPPEVARHAPPRLQRLLGYELYPPFVGHVAGADPARLLE